jgi:hypothetical protein
VNEAAPVAEAALVGVLDEVPAYRSQKLFAKAVFGLQFVLTVRKPAALWLQLVFTRNLTHPEYTQFSFNFFAPLRLQSLTW